MWTKENGDNICSDCNWELQETTPRFSRRHYQAFVQVLNVIIDNLDTVHTTKVRQQLLESSVLLDEIGKELTIFRFELDEDGNLNKESLNNKFVQLRSGSK